MPRNASRLALAVGFLAVLALAIGLMQLTRSPTEAAAPHPASRPAAPASRVPPAPTPAAAPATAAREAAPAAIPRAPASPPPRRPELTPAPSFGRAEFKRDANGNLVPIVGYTLLRTNLYLTDGPMRACIERSGQRPTGQAMLSFTVAARGGKLVIETTGIDDADSLGPYPDLLDCMHHTAEVLATVLDGQPIPELGTSVYVRRRVRLDGGALAENAYFNFSYSH